MKIAMTIKSAEFEIIFLLSGCFQSQDLRLPPDIPYRHQLYDDAALIRRARRGGVCCWPDFIADSEEPTIYDYMSYGEVTR